LMSIAASDGFVWRWGNERALIVEASIDISRHRASVRASAGVCCMRPERSRESADVVWRVLRFCVALG
ncbi:MAG: hypothetical protein KDB00_22850, partial [Planctomycetales bacterium]|nr:hypothetical protein [Planctomycetales bacterium]